MQNRTLDVVIPVFNEANGLSQFHESLQRTLSPQKHACRFIYVDDGSTDDTANILRTLASSDPRIVIVMLSRNFGHQAALNAGLDLSDADAVLMMDGDGQHPPELIPQMFELFESGFDVVQAKRMSPGASSISGKVAASSFFYRLINWIGDTRIVEGGADFRLLSRAAVKALAQMPEYHRFYRGMVPWLGFRSAILPFNAADRIAGHSKYSFRKMLALARDGLFSFSLTPLRIAIFFGTLFLLLAIGEVIYILSLWASGNTASLVPGWSSLMIMMTVSSGVSMLLVGILGIYVGMIFQEVKRRPVYFVDRILSQRDLPFRESSDSDEPSCR